MHEREGRGVERQPLEGHRERPSASAAVDRVARDRVAERRHVDPDLVRATRLETHLDEREVGEALEDAIACDGAA